MNNLDGNTDSDLTPETDPDENDATETDSADAEVATVTTVTINPQTLGRYRAELKIIRETDLVTLNASGFKTVDDAVAATLLSLSLRAKTSVEDLSAQIETLTNRSSGGGVRESDKLARDTLITNTQDLFAVCNLAINVNRGVTLLTNAEKVKAFDAMGVSGVTLADNLKASFSPIGGMTMGWNPASQDAKADNGLCVYIGGWEDGSKNMRYQYAPRKCPISKRSGYRDDSFQTPLLEMGKPAPEPETT